MTNLSLSRVSICSFYNNLIFGFFARSFSSSCINKLPGPEKEDPGVISAFSGSTRSLPDSFHDKQINPQPPFKNEQLDIAKKVK